MVLTAYAASGHPVGDSWVPDEEYGWSDTATSPNSSFVPYLICTPVSTNKIDGSFQYPDSDTWYTYQVSGFGSTREQCEWLMDDVREQTSLLRSRIVAGVANPQTHWKVSHVDTTSVGGIVRGGQDESPIFGQTDTFTLFLSEEYF
jgi:hypothetical protein